MEDTYKTIKLPSKETLFKDRNSKFYGFAFPVITEDDVKEKLDEVKKMHTNAGHYCYAYQIGVEDAKYRANDDGEPNNSAGLPIYGQIQSFNLTNVLVVSVRYFGGTKLGVSGLINAYRTSAQLSIEASEILEKIIQVHFQLNFEYDLMSKVMRIIKERNLDILNQELTESCEFKIGVRKNDANAVFDLFNNLYKVDIKKLEPHSL